MPGIVSNTESVSDDWTTKDPEAKEEVGRPRIKHRWIAGVEVKRCSTCQGWLPLEEFGNDKSRWDLLQSSCRLCSSQFSKAYREANLEACQQYDREYGRAHREKKTAARVQWRAENPERDRATRERYNERHRDSIRARDRHRSTTDERDRRLAYNRKYYEADRAKRIAQVAQWRIDNPHQAAIVGRRARARRRAREAGLPTERWTEEQVIARDGLVCWISGCVVGLQADGIRRDWDIDHLIPIAADYPDHPGDVLANVAIACSSCNRSKSEKVLPEAEGRYRSNLTEGDD